MNFLNMFKFLANCYMSRTYQDPIMNQDPIMKLEPHQDLTMKLELQSASNFLVHMIRLYGIYISDLELQSASNFLVHMIRLDGIYISDNKLEKFRLALVDVLRHRCRDHWFTENPLKGSGYRCIRINGKMDPVIMQAAESCGVSVQFLQSAYPSELTMWIDPLEVSYRIGENGRICVLYEFKEGVNDPWRHNMKNTPRFHLPSGRWTMDYLHDPRKFVPIEQLVAYVSS
jgi:protein Tob/BTG